MRSLLHPPAALRDLALLLTRVVLGVVLMAHGWQKLGTNGIDGVAAGFGKMGIPASELAAWFAALVELVGGALILVGLATPLVALLVVLNMAGAFWFAHRDGGVFVTDGGWELVAVIAAASLALIGAGAGRISLDGLLGRGRGSRDGRRPVGDRESVGATRA
ncbi:MULTISPECIES: DoxX family protein [Arsenicicoccus]|uniref:DoxX family protein n=1 Tax=Arsenicicoccus bolidensis TaxID=229480 RepID=A0ABS9Q1K0_9MICO|nr:MULTISPECIES: DoxX family protein [Arsenicicoccus]MCG7321742.1 DoxX family protein [Arsenicicoccus bolidensis]